MLAVLMVFYSAERVIYLLWNHNEFAQAPIKDILLGLVYGLRFDIYSLIFINAIPILLGFVFFEKFQKLQIDILKVLVLLLNVPFLAINQVDVEFSNFAGRRMTLGNLHILTEAQGKISAFLTTYGFLILLHTTLMILFIVATLKIASHFKHHPIKLKALHCLIIILLTIPLLALGARGGLQRKPLSVTHAIIFDGSYLNQMVLNSSFTILRSKTSNQIKELHDFEDFEELKPFLNGFDANETVWKENLADQKTNVVILIFESLSLDYMEFTPYLNELSKKGLFLTNAYANGRRSIEGIPAILAGLPALMGDSYIRSPYFNNELRGLGSYFKKLGYRTSFFHGGLPGTMFFDQFTRKAGFDHYYSSDDHPNPKDSDGFWGIYDEPFLQFALSEMDKNEKPFFDSIFTLTSHHPYKIPHKYKDKMPKGKIPILQAIYYTDYSIKKFFEEAEKKPWFKNTLFIITADHTSLPYTQEFDNALGRYRVPIIFYHPSITKWPEIDANKLSQQVDIMPTLLDMFKIEDLSKNLFGKSIFNNKPSKVVVLSDQTYYLVDDNLAIEMKPAHPLSSYDISKSLNFDNFVENKPEMEMSLKATLQYYNNGLIHNSIYLK